MIISVEQARKAVSMFVENEIAAKASGMTRFGAYFFLGAMQNKFNGIVVDLLRNPIVAAMELTDVNGNIKIDEVYNAARSAMEKCGSISAMGIIFNQADLDKLYQLMQTV